MSLHNRRRGHRKPAPNHDERAQLLPLLALSATLVWPSLAFSFVRTETCIDDDPGSSFACDANEQPKVIAWNTACVTYRLHESIDPDGEIGTAIKAAFDAWSQVSCSYLDLQFAGTTDQNVVGFDRKFGGDGNFNISIIRSDWGGRPNRTVALTSVSYGIQSGEIFDADIEFNDEFFDFGVIDDSSVTSPVMDWGNVATHEVGHLVGLDHASSKTLVGTQPVSDTTMFIQTFAGETKRRTLAEDDIAGICDAYPIADAPAGQCPTPTPDYTKSPDGFQPGRPFSGDSGCGCSATQKKSPSAWTVAWLLALLTLRQRRKIGTS